MQLLHINVHLVVKELIVPELNPTHLLTESLENIKTNTTTATPAASQVIRSVISDIRRCIEAEADDPDMTLQEEQFHTNSQEGRVDRPMRGINSVCVERGQCTIGNIQPNREDGLTRFEQHWKGGQQRGVGRTR